MFMATSTAPTGELLVDLGFLDVEMPRLARQRGPVNVYRLLGLAGSELAADQSLAYFLDPSERHGMGSALVDALLSLLADHPVLNGEGRVPESPFQAEPCMGSTAWAVQRQAPVSAPEKARSELNWPGFMDLYLTNVELDIAVIIENKIDAPLNNPLESYASHALAEGYSIVLLAVLAPHVQTLRGEHARWATRAITYDEMFQRLTSSDSPDLDSSLDVRRSLDVLQQFREATERSETTMGYENDTEFVNAFRQMLAEHEGAVAEFFDAVQQINALFRERSKRLAPLIQDRLDTVGLKTGWESHSQQNARWVYAWNAYQLVDSDNSIELIMTPDPRRAGPITAKAYPGRTYKYYPDFDHITFGVDWHASDEEVAESFIAVVRRLVAEHPAGS